MSKSSSLLAIGLEVELTFSGESVNIGSAMVSMVERIEAVGVAVRVFC